MFFTLLLKLRLINRKTKRILIEKEIIDECRNGNLQNFRKIVALSSPFAFTVAFRMLGDDEQAKDIVQETMITLWKNIKKIRSTESFRTWLYRIVVNKCYDQLRKKSMQKEFRTDEQTWELIVNHTISEQNSELEYKETAQIINLLTERLSPVQKAVFVLGILEEMTNDEISLITGISKRNVKANLYHARKHMSEMIKKHI
jgi:RNA polymerase sigma-70 factor (ECF subfamily)